LLEDLLTEFHFVAATDKAAALSAIFTAVVRPSLPHAPGFHARAPVFGSGKTYLCELIGAFAGPAGKCQGELSDDLGGSHQGDSVPAADQPSGDRVR
jgi:hypothetical protein